MPDYDSRTGGAERGVLFLLPTEEINKRAGISRIVAGTRYSLVVLYLLFCARNCFRGITLAWSVGVRKILRQEICIQLRCVVASSEGSALGQSHGRSSAWYEIAGSG